MKKEHKNLMLYVAKCLTGSAIAFGLAWYFGIKDISWFLISIVLVVSPDSEEAIPLAVTRIKANLIGSFCSFVLLISGLHNPFGISLGFAMAIVLCYFFKAMAGSRVALAAVVIIMLHNPDIDLWTTVEERILSVIAGCAVGLMLTYMFHKELRKKKPLRKKARVKVNKHGE